MLPLASVSMEDAFPGLTITAPKLSSLAAGPHSAQRNSRGGLAVIFWPVQDGTVRVSSDIYAPNLEGGSAL